MPAGRRSPVAGRGVAACLALALVLLPDLAAASGEVDTGTQPGLAARLGAITGALCDTAERDLVAPSRQAAAAVLAHPRTQQLWGQVGDAAHSLGASANTHILQPLSRELAELFTRSGLRQSYQRVGALVGGLLERLRLSILDPLISSLQQAALRVTASPPAPARPRLATAADPPTPALVIPGLPESDILRNLKGEDPLEAFNRLMFGLNGGLQANLLGPVSELYAEDAPADLQLGIGNFFRNLREPATLVSSAFEGRLDDAGTAAARFAINTTLGIAGFRDPATALGYTVRPRNFEETLCTYELPAGPYLVLPILGPATLRDAAGRLATVVMYFEVMGASVYIPYRISDFTVQYALVKDKMDLINTLSRDPYTAQKALYLAMRDLGCGSQSTIHREFFAR